MTKIFKSVFYAVNGTLSVMIYFVNTVVLSIPLILFSFLKLIPNKHWRRAVSGVVDGIATLWISINNMNQAVFSRTQFKLQGDYRLAIDQWYLVISNHQSWVDILVLQRIFNRNIPFLKFFLKKNLIYVPFLGLAWWALDFPFMQRYSKAFIKQNPHLKGKDLETTRKACKKFEFKPVSIMNFVEGTRFEPHKAKKQDDYQHLLRPRSGGIAFVLNAMGERLTKLVNVTIYYPQGIPSYWDFVSGKVKTIVVDVQTIDIKSLLASGVYSSAYFTDDTHKQLFQDWINQLWKEKDEKLKQFALEHSQT
ncbi:acyltransferase [Glaciecola siphonariae]|uniref:Acyltransferase n=1 Tax=Glaciecola siphonariae TaxID=521012 RepID=A0ABV9M1X9_9ALTE